MKKDKKGLSPVIATVLLIMLALVLAMIILIWVKSFMGEQVTKNLGSGNEPIESFCEDVEFATDAIIGVDELKIVVQNNGDVPIYGVEVREIGSFSVKTIGVVEFSNSAIPSGETKESIIKDVSLSEGKDVLIVPILLGESESGKKYYTCNKEFGVETQVQA